MSDNKRPRFRARLAGMILVFAAGACSGSWITARDQFAAARIYQETIAEKNAEGDLFLDLLDDRVREMNTLDWLVTDLGNQLTVVTSRLAQSENWLGERSSKQ